MNETRTYEPFTFKLNMLQRGKFQLFCFLFYHKWIIDEDTGATTYKHCERCGAKQILQYNEHQPINFKYFKND